MLLWRRRFEQEGLSGILEDRRRSGRPKQVVEASPDLPSRFFKKLLRIIGFGPAEQDRVVVREERAPAERTQEPDPGC